MTPQSPQPPAMKDEELQKRAEEYVTFVHGSVWCGHPEGNDECTLCRPRYATRRAFLAGARSQAELLAARVKWLEEEAERLKKERNYLAENALVILSANGIYTPERGYVEEPYYLAGDIKTLARERDTERERAEDAEARVKRLTEALKSLAVGHVVPLEAVMASPADRPRILAKALNEELQERAEFARQALAEISPDSQEPLADLTNKETK